MADRRCIGLGMGLAAAVLAVDQLSKWWFIHGMGLPVRPPIEVTPFFNLVMVWNTGISFGMFSEQNQPVILIALSLIIIAILGWWLYTTPSSLVAGALGTTIGGAAGNIADRLQYGAVADFFDFHVAGYHWPAFNIADSAIFMGVVLLCLHSMFMEHRKPNSGSSS